MQTKNDKSGELICWIFHKRSFIVLYWKLFNYKIYIVKRKWHLKTPIKYWKIWWIWQRIQIFFAKIKQYQCKHAPKYTI